MKGGGGCIPVCYGRVLALEEDFSFLAYLSWSLTIGHTDFRMEGSFELTTSIFYRDTQSPLKSCIKCLTGHVLRDKGEIMWGNKQTSLKTKTNKNNSKSFLWCSGVPSVLGRDAPMVWDAKHSITQRWHGHGGLLQ